MRMVSLQVHSAQPANRYAEVSKQLEALKQCSQTRNIRKGKQVHAEAIELGTITDTYVCSSLINMYSRCSIMEDAQHVFRRMACPDVVCWNCLIQGYVENGESERALEVFSVMEKGDGTVCVPNARTFVAALTACSALAAREEKRPEKRWRWLERGRIIHKRAVMNSCVDIFVETALVDMYVKCGSIAEARRVFDTMGRRNVITWTALLQGYVESGEGEIALELLEKMEKAQDGCVPDERTYLVAVTACSSLAGKDDDGKCNRRWLQRGRALHFRAVMNSCCDIFVETALMDMYGKFRRMAEARRVFDNMVQRNVVAWNVLIQGYVENDESEVALEVFDAMRRDSCFPDSRTYVAALTACTSLGTRENGRKWLEKGREIYERARMSRCANSFVENTFMHMFASCGNMDEAHEIFNNMVSRDVVSWNCLLQGYFQSGESELVLRLLPLMDVDGHVGTAATYAPALLACGSLMAVERGRELHAEILSSGLEKDVLVSTCLVDFYGKCGCTGAAKEIFDKMAKKTVVSWNALLCGYGLQGDATQALGNFERMREQGVCPDEITFTHLLTACSHAGLTEKGREVFESMSSEYGISPDVTHHGCMVDLLSRANHLEEALVFVRRMPFRADVSIWITLLSACWKWSNETIGKLAYDSLLNLDDHDSTAYVLMANLKTVEAQESCSEC